MALFPIGIVMKLTQLTARQIRYYEAQRLIKPDRNSGNQRIFSLNDIDRLLEIKDLIDQGINIAGIKAIYQSKKEEDHMITSPTGKGRRDLTDQEVHKLLKTELFSGRPGEKVSLIQGQLSQFFNNFYEE